MENLVACMGLCAGGLLVLALLVLDVLAYARFTNLRCPLMVQALSMRTSRRKRKAILRSCRALWQRSSAKVTMGTGTRLLQLLGMQAL